MKNITKLTSLIVITIGCFLLLYVLISFNLVNIPTGEFYIGQYGFISASELRCTQVGNCTKIAHRFDIMIRKPPSTNSNYNIVYLPIRNP